MHRIAIIGAGDIVRKAYLPELSKRGDCRVTALCSQSGTSAQELAEHYTVPVYTNDYKQLLKRDDVDVVFICTPTVSHREMAEAALKAEKHVLVEKPLCVDYPSSHALLQRAKRSKKILYPAFNNAFREENRYFIERAARGELGSLELIDFEWYRTKRHETKSWLYDAGQSGGGVLIDLGAHLIHMALGLLPERRRYNVFSTNTHHSTQNPGAEDTAICTMVIDERITILLKTGWDMRIPERSRVNLTVIGKQGVASNHDYHGVKSEGYPAMLEDCMQHFAENRAPDLSLVDDTMLVLEALYDSNRRKTCVTGKFGNLV